MMILSQIVSWPHFKSITTTTWYMFVVSFPTSNLIMYDWSGCKTWMWSVRIHARNKGTIFKAWCAAIWSGALLFESVRTLSMPDYQYRLLREVKTANWYVLFCSATPFAELCEGPFTKKIFIITKIFQIVKVQWVQEQDHYYWFLKLSKRHFTSNSQEKFFIITKTIDSSAATFETPLFLFASQTRNRRLGALPEGLKAAKPLN